MDAPMVRRTDVRADLAACTATAAEPARTALPAAAAPRPSWCKRTHTHTRVLVFSFGGGGERLSVVS